MAVAACASVAPPSATESLRLIAFNDFHGHLEPPPFGLDVADPQNPGKTKRVAAGGVAYLAGAIRDLKQGHANTAVVAAGDLVSASPLVSSIFKDEPSVDALSAAGLELSSVGNHEFDRGREELMRLQGRARYQWLAANVIDTATRQTLFPAYVVREYGGIPVAFIGVVLRSTPRMVMPAGIKGLQFRDEAETVNALVPELRARGVEAIVLLIHEGGQSSTRVGERGCEDFTGAIVSIVKRLDRAVDVVVSGHTHHAYTCRVDGRLVTSAGSYGRLVTTIDVTLDRKSRDIVAANAELLVVSPERFAADPAIAAEVQRVAARAAVVGERVVATLEGQLTNSMSAAGESNLGDFVADANLEAMREEGAQIAFTNPGGLRAPLASRRPGNAITFGDVYAVQPFGNTLVAMTLTGAQILRGLELPLRTIKDRVWILQVAGLRYAWDGTQPAGARVVPGTVFVGGKPLDPDARYRVAVNSYLADAGDGYSIFKQGTDVAGGPNDVDALVAYLASSPRRAQPQQGRISRIDR